MARWAAAGPPMGPREVKSAVGTLSAKMSSAETFPGKFLRGKKSSGRRGDEDKDKKKKEKNEEEEKKKGGLQKN